MERYRALTDPECGDCWLVRDESENDPGIVAMCGQERDAEMVARALNNQGAVTDRDRLLVALAQITGPDVADLDAAKSRAQRALDSFGGQ